MGEDNGKTVMTKEDYMRLALDIARKGRGRTSPNPMVGCVVVRNQRIVAEGYHERYGGFHAERNALTRCTEDLTGAEMYVTLEPCCHYGNTPPCTEIIIERGISKVYVGCMDANPQVAGKRPAAASHWTTRSAIRTAGCKKVVAIPDEVWYVLVLQRR